MQSKVKLTKSQNIKPVEKITLGMFLTILIPSRLRGSTAKVGVMQKSKILTTMAKSLKNIIKNARLIILNTVILTTLQAFAKDFSAEGYTSKLIDRLGEKKR